MDNDKFAGNNIGVGCGCIILNKKGEILLVKRSKDLRNEAGMWSRPGGTVEFGETITEALVREIREEIGIEIEIIKFLEYTDIINKEEGTHWVALGFLAKRKSGEVKNLIPHEHDEVRWFQLDRLPKNVTHYTRNSIIALRHKA